MTRAELVQEVVDRGYDYVSTARIGRFVDTAYRRICSQRNWPFLEAEAQGAPPLELADLWKVLSVSANEHPLSPADRRWLVAAYPNLTDEGEPVFWYLENTTLKSYPVTSDEVAVRYRKRPTALADSEEPLIPEEFQDVIVDLAIVPCLKDDDEFQEARELKLGEVKEGIQEMAAALLGRNNQSAETVQRTGQPGDYLG